MGILSTIFDKLRGHAKAAPAGAQPSGTTTTANAQPAPGATAGTPGAATATAAKPAALNDVDVENVMEQLAAKNPQKLNWRTSIVDLMKLLGMQSSLQERKELADELGYKGDKSDSAAMNVWLHQQVMHQFAENGGKVPANMMD